MTDTEIRPSLSASSAAAVADRIVSIAASASRMPAPLTPEALAVAARPAPTPISPIVLAGFVRMGEFALSSWSALRSMRLLAVDGRADLALSRRNVRHRAVVDARLPDRRHLPGAGVPRLRKAIHAACFGLVGRLPDRHRRIVLRQSRRHVLACLARHPITSVGL